MGKPYILEGNLKNKEGICEKEKYLMFWGLSLMRVDFSFSGLDKYFDSKGIEFSSQQESEAGQWASYKL